VENKENIRQCSFVACAVSPEAKRSPILARLEQSLVSLKILG